MSSVKQITSFNTLAENMIKSLATNSPAKNTYVRNFYRTANERGLQSNALISYYTKMSEVQSLPKRSYREFFGIKNADKEIINETKNRINKLDEEVMNIAIRNAVIREELQKFVSSLNVNYPKTLLTRLAILSQGAVVDGAVKPTSMFKKIVIKFLEALGKES